MELKANYQEFKKTIFALGLGVIMLSAVINIFNQLFTLLKAKGDNQTLEAKAGELENRKMELTEKIKVASDPAFIESQRRELLGLGTKDDYWVIMPKNVNINGVYPKTNIGDEKSNLSKWIGMFTD